jgi:TolB-like protein/DNA-binding winged helix-turn-helix (wHTH) protein/tetratricopeptide (TPR) repeat protein
LCEDNPKNVEDIGKSGGCAFVNGGDDNVRSYRFADLVLDPGRRQVFRGDDSVELTGKTFDVLAALVRAAPNSLSYDALMDEAWAGSVVSQGTVAKRIELLRQALGDDSSDPKYVGLVRGCGYRLLPDVSVIEESAETRRERVPSPSARWAIAAAVVLALAFLGWSMFDPAARPPEKSIAVLPFVSLSGDDENQRFADGLTEELGHTLASDARLSVTGRISASRYRDSDEDVRRIGEHLGVAHVLEGSVRRSGDGLRVTARLISTKDGFNRWSESYDGSMDDIFAIQKDIADSVAQELNSSLDGRRASRSVDESVIDPETYAMYLRAVSLSPYGSVHGLGEAQRLIEAVTELAPGFAPGWNRLAAIHGRRLMGQDPDYEMTLEEAMPVMLSAVAKAVAIEPDSAEAYANLGGAAWVFEGDSAKAAPLIERALALGPNDLDIISFAAEFAKFNGRLDEALELEQRILVRDPLCDWCRSRLAKSYLLAGKPEEAKREYETLRSLHEGEFNWNYGVVLLMLGRPRDALESFARHDLEYLKLQGQAAAHCALGDSAAAEAMFARLEQTSAQEHPQQVAKAYAYCGKADRAFELLQQSLPEGAVSLQMEYLSPLYGPLRDDPRWLELLRRVGRAPEQIEAIPFSLEVARSRLEN